MKIVCNECGNEMEHHILKDKKVMAKPITRLYIKCDECGEEYDIMYKCPEMDRLIDKRKNLAKDTMTYTPLTDMMVRNKIDEINNRNKKMFKGGI